MTEQLNKQAEKIEVEILLSVEVLEYFKAMGDDWERMI